MINLTGRTPSPKTIASAPTSERSIRIIETEENLEPLKDFWREATGDGESPFSTWDWNLAWLRHFGRNGCAPDGSRPLFLVTESKSGDPRCIFPFREAGGTLDLAGSELCDFQDVITRSEDNIAPCLEALFRQMQDEEWELSLTKLSERGTLLSALEKQAHREDLLFDFHLHGPCPWMRIRGNGLQEVTAQFSKSTRKGLRRRIRQLEEQCDAGLRVMETLEPGFLEKAATIHRNRHEDSVFDSPSFLAFLADVDASGEVGLTAFALESGEGELIAFEIGFVRAGRFSSWLGGYDPAFSEFRPGTSLQTLVMVELAEREIREYDFLCGGEQYKFHFADEEYAVRTARVMKRHPFQSALIGLQRAERKVRPFLKRSLQRAGLYKTSYRIDGDLS